MKRKFVVQPFKPTSGGAKLLAAALSNIVGYEVQRKNPGFVPSADEIVVNWGCGFHNIYNPNNAQIINPSHIINRVINKVDFLHRLDDHPGVVKIPHTGSSAEAARWLRDGHAVFCRTEVEGADGAGIVIAHKPGELVPAPLYTKQCPSTEEFRIHVFRDQVLTELAKRPYENEYHPEIRTGGHGWHYRRDIDCPPIVRFLASKCAKAIGLDFGGVDVLYNKPTKEAWVLEANSAPELGPHTSPLLARAIVDHCY